MAAIAISCGRPVFFRQERAGLHGRTFRLVKLRTMRAPLPGRELLDDEQRTTRMGELLRTTSLDELPGLINVLRGEMSLVGPRPLLPEYLPHYSARQARRHEVRPGITGLAQVRGRNSLSWEEKFDLDVEYVERHDLWLDLRIMGGTLACFVRRDEAAVPSVRFVGSPPGLGNRTSVSGRGVHS